MTRIILIFILYCPHVYGQVDGKIYSVNLGKYQCVPDFYENKYNSKGLLSAVDQSKVQGDFPIRIPKRIDTIIRSEIIKGVLKTFKKEETINEYRFVGSIDSIKIDELENITKQEITISYKSKKLKLSSYIFDIVYSDGERVSIPSKTTRIVDNLICKTALTNGRSILYVGIWRLQFKKRWGKSLEIYEGYGWKVNSN
jgi:hypothetical protein